MKFSTQQFGGSSTARNETLFSLGNGNIGFRGDTEEKSGTVHKGTYINGFYDSEPILYGENAYGYARNHETILNLPDSKRIELYVDGVPFGTGGTDCAGSDCGTVSAFCLSVDTQTGILTRETDWSCGSSSVSLHSERLVSFTHEDCAAIRYTVTNTSQKDSAIILQSYIDTTVTNILAEEDPRIGAKFRHVPLIIDEAGAADGVMSFSAHTALSGLFLSGDVRHTLCVDGNGYAWSSCSSEQNVPVCTAEFVLPAGKSFTLTKYICYEWSREIQGLSKKTCLSCSSFATAGFDVAKEEQHAFLQKFWDVARIEIEGDPQSEEALLFNLFHLLQSAGRSGKVSIAAKGLTSEGYEGHFFWDTESYVCPVFTYTAPEIAHRLLSYRASILDKAKVRAAEVGVKGALYPWRTIDGEETSAYFPAGTAQYHINADIMFALNRYLNAHAEDIGFDAESLKEMAAQTARMYASLGSYIPHKDNAFCINDVTGPDEYTAIVNNNAFTNLMARENLEMSVRYAGDHATQEEKDSWKKAADRMFIPFDKAEGVYPQDDSFMDKSDWDFANTPKENYPLLLHYHPLVIYRHRVLKQPDLVLAQFLLSGRFSLAEKKRNFRFYEKYTTGDSSLSHCIMSIMAAETGDTKKSLEYFNKTVRMDIDDVNGNSRDGIHTACMAGSWMSVVYGFAGFHDYGGSYSFDPRLPENWKRLTFSLAIQGAVLDITLTQDEAVYALRPGAPHPFTFCHRNEKCTLRDGEKHTFSLKRSLRAVLFDLDGVITDTAPLHFKAWKELADRESLSFDAQMNRKLLGISREESLEVILRENGVRWSEEKKAAACTQKNERYKELLKSLSPKDILPGIPALLNELRKNNIAAALASSSKNAPAILHALGIEHFFTAVADASLVQKAKPEPDIFLAAAGQCGVWHTDCVGIEDADAGVSAIHQAGMKAVGVCSSCMLEDADVRVRSTADITLALLRECF